VVVSHQSAARYWRLTLLVDDGKEHGTFPRNNSHQPAISRGDVVPHRADLPPDAIVVVGGVHVTTPLRTVCDLARTLPFAEALTVADSALRTRRVWRGQLLRAAAQTYGRGAARVRRVAAHADGGAGSAAESLARALFIDARLGRVATQIRFAEDEHPYDIAFPDAEVIVEIDGWKYHRERFEQDAEELVEAVVHGWVVLRLTFRLLRDRPEWVVAAVRTVLGRERRRGRRR
jgi:very-short-patch-repair endonuclease